MPACYEASPSIASASATSRSVTPSASWLVSRKSTLFHALVKFGVVVDLLGVKRDPSQEGERFAEVLEGEAPDQSLAAVLDRPAVGCVHICLP